MNREQVERRLESLKGSVQQVQAELSIQLEMIADYELLLELLPKEANDGQTE
jgi:hypothetical protein